MKCERCWRDLPPAHHEYCTEADRPKIVNYNLPTPSEYVAPKVQGELKHQIAPPGAKPPLGPLFGIPGIIMNKPWQRRKPDQAHHDAPPGIRPKLNNK